jgi:hypothetical protein
VRADVPGTRGEHDMSTKNIRAVLDAVRSGQRPAVQSVTGAVEEVEAIEKAARVHQQLRDEGRCSAKDAEHRDAVFGAIARESGQ